MDYLIYAGILAAGFVIYKLDRWLERERESRRDLERRVAELEARPPTNPRLSHRDTMNLENAQAAFLKALLDLDNIQDYLRNGLEWAGKVRTLGEKDDDDDEPAKSRWP